MDINPGGCYCEIDDTIKVQAEIKDSSYIQLPSMTPEKNFPKLLLWDDIKIEGLGDLRIQSIKLECNAGDVVTAHISYYVEDTETKTNKIVTEEFHLKNFSFQTSMRLTHIYWESKRRKVLGLDKKE